MKKWFLFYFLLCYSITLAAQPQYTRSDSLKVMRLLKTGKAFGQDENLMVRFARELKGLPYVGKTLDRNANERLVVNLRQMDCTTYVENVLALAICTRKGLTTFRDFCRQLQLIRYRQGHVSYTDRLHYFSAWIEDNTRLGFVREVQAPNPPFTAVQTLRLNYMSRNPHLYPMLVRHPGWVSGIADMEQRLEGLTYSYIPKQEIANDALFRSTIHDGDIIAITTSREGLDTSHIGIAVWHADGLHMLNASTVHGRVVEEPMLLKAYMKRHPSQVGIRIIHVL
ncbi:MAG: DUF1460 domain-containing protein [Prevotella sp.]|nr:DUF1460 domain-containing protein [Prevotella sp.]